MRPRSYRASGDPRTPGPPRGRFRWAATPPWPSHARRLASTRASPRPGRRRPGPRQPSDWGRIENASWRSCPWPPWLPFRKKANPMRDVRDCLYWMSQDFRICRGSGALVLPDVIVEAATDDAAGEGRVLAAEGTLSDGGGQRSEEHTSELQSPCNLVCRLLLEKKKNVSSDRTAAT